jgi:O-antigen ligase/tetratricopeptide (TPR) repeat protein
MNQKTITNIFKYSIITGLCIIPFIPLIPLPYITPWANNFFFPFIGGKAFVFRIIIEIVFALWLVLMWRDKTYAPKWNWMTVTVTTFTLIALIADLFGMNPLRSIWSNFERMEGWITIAHLWGYFMVLSAIFKDKKLWNLFFHITLFSALITAIYGLFQFFGWAQIHQSAARLDSSLGNAAYLGVYMLIHFFIALYMSSISWLKKNVVVSWIYIVEALIFAFVIFQTQTRGSVFGVLIGFIITLIIYLIKAKGEKTGKIVAGSLMALIILACVGVYLARNTAFVQNNATLSRIVSISLSDIKTSGRSYILPMALKGVFSSPKTAIIGWGQENFNYIFNSNYNPKMYNQEQWFDRAHSVFVDWLVAGGLLGLLAYLSLFLLVLIYVWKSELGVREKSVMIGLLVGYGIHNVFVFDNLSSYILFFSIIGFAYSLRPSKAITLFHKDMDPVIRDYIIMPVSVILLVATLYFINVRPITASTRLITALRQCQTNGKPDAALFEKALALNQYVANQEIREQLLSCSANVIKSNLPTKTKTEFFDLTLREIENQTKATPKDARAYILAGSFLNGISNFPQALSYLEKANELSPNKQTIMFDLASAYLNLGKTNEATELLKRAYESETSNQVAKIAYVVALVSGNQEKKARELFGNDEAIFSDQRVIGAYVKNKQYDKVVDIYKAIVAKNPDDLQNRFYLVGAYLGAKKNWLALSELNTLKQKAPEYKAQIDDLIKQIQEGKNPLGE